MAYREFDYHLHFNSSRHIGVTLEGVNFDHSFIQGALSLLICQSEKNQYSRQKSLCILNLNMAVELQEYTFLSVALQRRNRKVGLQYSWKCSRISHQPQDHPFNLLVIGFKYN